MLQPQQASIRRRVGPCCGEVVKRSAGGVNDVIAHEPRAFARAVFGVLQRTLPFNHGPAGKIVLRELGKHGREVDLTVAEGAKAARALDPGQVATIDSRTPVASIRL